MNSPNSTSQSNRHLFVCNGLRNLSRENEVAWRLIAPACHGGRGRRTAKRAVDLGRPECGGLVAEVVSWLHPVGMERASLARSGEG